MKHIIFDAFGTLFKVDVQFEELETLIPGKARHIIDSYRAYLLESTWVTSLAKTFISFDQLCRMALSNAFLKHDLSNEKAFQILLKIYDHPLPYDDAEKALNSLYQNEFSLHILSNGTIQMLKNALHVCKWERYFRSIHSVERVRKYKPDPIVYKMACDEIHTIPADILFISSNAWDIFGAGQFGFTTAWINRTRIGAFPYQNFTPNYVIPRITELLDVI
jgi:2-haloacid dehalogenase